MAKKLEPKKMQPKITLVQVGLTPDEHKAVRVAAAEAGVSLNRFLHELVTKWLEKK